MYTSISGRVALPLAAIALILGIIAVARDFTVPQEPPSVSAMGSSWFWGTGIPAADHPVSESGFKPGDLYLDT